VNPEVVPVNWEVIIKTLGYVQVVKDTMESWGRGDLCNTEIII
jgi:hypothetical protein